MLVHRLHRLMAAPVKCARPTRLSESDGGQAMLVTGVN